MTPREQLPLGYQLAFQKQRLNAVWNDWEQQRAVNLADLRATVDWAFIMHRRLPEAPAVSGRAHRRLSGYQASSGPQRLPWMLQRFRRKFCTTAELPSEVPAWMVRKIALPVLGEATAAERMLKG